MKELFLIGLTLIILSFGGCKEPLESEPTYPVWTDTITYTEFQSDFSFLETQAGSPLEPGRLLYAEITSLGWSQAITSLTNEGRHEWTEKDLYNWFIGRGLNETLANHMEGLASHRRSRFDCL